MADDKRPPDSFLIPIVSLRVPGPWRVGRSTIHPGQDWERLIADAPPIESEGGVIRDHVLEVLGSAEKGSIAEVRGLDEIDDALEALQSSLDALRLFQLSRRRVQTSSFGLPGDLYQSTIEYVAKWDRSAAGWRFRGDTSGWEFDEVAANEWAVSPTFQFLSDALEDPDRSEGARRAVVGTQLFSRAAAEHRRDVKMIGFASGLEAWLLRRQPAAQTFRLARHVTWFGCGIQDENQCGRARPVCSYLRLSPDRPKDRQRLSMLRDLGNTYPAWRCSEWHRIMDWYDSRSGAVHGDPAAVDVKESSSAEFWIAHYLAPPILDWLRTHPDDPVGDLEHAINSVAVPERWDAMLAALDSPNPPPVPPLD